MPVRDARRAFPAVARLGRVTLCRVFGRLPRAARPSWRAAANEVPGLPVLDFLHHRPAGAEPILVDLAGIEATGVTGICLMSWEEDLRATVAHAAGTGLPVHVFGRSGARFLQSAVASFHAID